MKRRIAAFMLALMMLTLAACGGQKNDNGAETTVAETTVETTEEETTAAEENNEGVVLSDVVEAIAAAYGENFLANMPIDEEYLEGIYGVTSDMYDDFVGQMPMMSAHVDTLLIFKAKEGQVDTLKETLEAYRTYQLEEGMHYPSNVPKIEASEVVVYGDYVCYVMLGTIDMAIEEEAEMLTAFQEQNQIAKGILEEMLK